MSTKVEKLFDIQVVNISEKIGKPQLIEMLTSNKPFDTLFLDKLIRKKEGA